MSTPSPACTETFTVQVSIQGDLLVMPYGSPSVRINLKKVDGSYPTLSGVNLSLVSGTVTDGTWSGSFNFDGVGCSGAVGEWYAEANVYSYGPGSVTTTSPRLYFNFNG